MLLSESYKNRIQELGATFNPQVDILFLKDFKLNNFNNLNKWVFGKNPSRDYLLQCEIVKEEEGWFLKFNIFWKSKTKHFTNNKGKDFEFEIGPEKDYTVFCKKSDDKFNANKNLISPQNYKDDFLENLNTEIIKICKMLKQKIQDLQNFDKNKFSDLVSFYNEIKNFTNEKEFREFLNKKYASEQDKQNLTLILQKMDEIPLYNNLKNF